MSIAIPATLLYGGLNAAFTILLGLNISLRRLGAGGGTLGKALPDDMLRASRAHGNNTEWVPLGVVLLLLAELSGAPSLAVHAMGGALLAARISHAAGMILRNRLQLIGATLTYVAMTALAGTVLWMRFAGG